MKTDSAKTINTSRADRAALPGGNVLSDGTASAKAGACTLGQTNCYTLNIAGGTGAGVSNGGLTFTTTSAVQGGSTAGVALATGKYYYEYTWTSNSGSADFQVGAAASPYAGAQNLANTNTARSISYEGRSGLVYYKTSTGAASSLPGTAVVGGNTVGVAVDLSTSASNVTLTFYGPGGAQLATKTLARGSAGEVWSVAVSGNGDGATNAGSLNFGQSAFQYAPPAGYKMGTP